MTSCAQLYILHGWVLSTRHVCELTRVYVRAITAPFLREGLHHVFLLLLQEHLEFHLTVSIAHKEEEG